MIQIQNNVNFVYLIFLILLSSIILNVYLYRIKKKKIVSSKVSKAQISEDDVFLVPANKQTKDKSVIKSWNLTPLTPLQAKWILVTWFLYIILWIFLIYIWLISWILYTSILKFYPFLRIVFVDRIVFFVLGFSLLWWVANVFQSVILWNKSVNFYNNILSKEHLFTDKLQHKFILRKLLNTSYNKTWSFWVEVQPFLSMLVGIIIYFVLLSWINWSWSISTNPNVFFYSAVAFLSWFFYDKFLDFLQKLSSQILSNDSYNDRLMDIIDEFDIVKQGIIRETKTKEWDLDKDVLSGK